MLRRLTLVALAGCGGARPAPTPPPPAPPARSFAAHAAAPECRDGWCWENPLPRDRGAAALWGHARDDVWAVGNAGLIEHYDGTAWTTVPGIAKRNLYAVTGTGRDDVWAVGYVGTALHWDGTAWTAHDLDGLGYYPSAAGTDERGHVWVATERGVAVWDGRAWHEAASLECNAGACSSPIVRSAGGGAVIELPRGRWWAGGRVVTAHPSANSPYGGARSSRIWGSTFGVESWTETGHATLAKPFTPLRALWGATDRDVWAAGNGGALARWNGRSWSAVASSARGDLEGVWGSADDDVWITGDAALLHWDGQTLASATRSAGDADLFGVWGATACDVWAVGDHGTALHRACAGAWSTVASGVPGALRAVGGSSADDVWIVGDAGMILHWDGHALAREASPTTEALHAVSAASPGDAWAVGADGTIVHWDGARWSAAASPGHETLLRVTGDGHRAIAVGDASVFLEWDGASWTSSRVAVCTSDSRASTISGVARDGDGDGVIVSCDSSGVRARQPDGTWHDVVGSQGFAMRYLDLAARDGAVAIAGWYGTVAYRGTRGGAWTKLDAPTAWPLHAAWIGPDGAVWVAGDHGEILVYRR